MILRDFFFNSLSRQVGSEQAAVLIPAFRHCRDDERTLLAELFGRTGQPEAIRLLINHWNQISLKQRPGVARLTKSPKRAIELMLREPGPSRLLRIIEFVGDRGDALLMPILIDLLTNADTDVRSCAADAMVRIAVDHLGPHGHRATDRQSFAAIDAALARGLDTYRLHRRNDVLLAAAIMASRPGPKLRAVFEQPDHPGTIALRSVPQRIDEQLVRVNLIRWLGVPIMQRPALRWMDRVRTARQWSDVLAGGHLVLSPKQRRVLRRHPKPQRLLPNLANAVRLEAEAQSSLTDWVRACGLTTVRRVEYLRDLIALPSPLARINAVRALTELAGAGVVEAIDALAPFARDSNLSVAGLAQRSLRHVRSAAVGGDIEGVAELARKWSKLKPAQRLATTARMAHQDPEKVSRVLCAMLRSNRRDQALAAMMSASRLHLIDHIMDDLIQAMRSDDAHIAASAVRIVGCIAGRGKQGHIMPLMLRMLDHENARVRANAVEALAEVMPRSQTALDIEKFLNAEDNRLRANAVRALLHDAGMEPAGREHWQAMIRDLRPLHQISAIWVASRSPRPAMLNDLNHLASSEATPPEVRTRAESAAAWIDRHGRNALQGAAAQ